MVVCSRCNEEKNKSEFTSAQLKKSGMLRRCKACTTDIQISERRASVQAASRTDVAEAAPKYLEAVVGVAKDETGRNFQMRSSRRLLLSGSVESVAKKRSKKIAKQIKLKVQMMQAVERIWE